GLRAEVREALVDGERGHVAREGRVEPGDLALGERVRSGCSVAVAVRRDPEVVAPICRLPEEVILWDLPEPDEGDVAGVVRAERDLVPVRRGVRAEPGSDPDEEGKPDEVRPPSSAMDDDGHDRPGDRDVGPEHVVEGEGEMQQDDVSPPGAGAAGPVEK